MRLLIAIVTLLVPFYGITASSPLVFAQKHSYHSKAHKSARDYFIHLPESYHTNKNKKYPILYVLHGQTDTIGAVASTQAIDNDIPEMIIVGVQSQGKELRPVILSDGTTNQQGQSFKSFFLGELIPHIKQQYRVADFSILTGHSNSGRFVLNSLLDDANLFDAYFASSPSIEDNLINNRVKQQKPKLAATNTKLVLTLANEGDHMQKPYEELVSLFTQASSGGSFFYHKHYPEQSHGSSYLVSQLFALRSLFEGWRPNWDIKMKGVSSVIEHNNELAQRFGFDIEIPALEWLQMSFVFSRWQSAEGDKKAEEVVEYALMNYPNIADEFFDIVEQLDLNGLKQPSKNFHQLLCLKLKDHKECNGLTISQPRPEVKALPISTQEQQRIAGRYRYDTDMLFTIFSENNRVFMQYLDGDRMEVFRTGENQYVRKEYHRKFRFEKLKGDDSASLVFGINGETEHVRKRMPDGEKLPFEFIISGEFSKAEFLYTKLLQEVPTYKNHAEYVLLGYADKLNSNNKSKLALELYEMCSRLFATSLSLIKLAEHYERIHQVKKAIASLQKAQEIEPKNLAVLQALEKLGVKP